MSSAEPPAPWTSGRVASLVGAVCEGSEDLPLTGVASLRTAASTELSFCTGGRWLAALRHTHAGAVIAREGDPVPPESVALRHRSPRYAYAQAAAAMVPLYWPEPGVHPTACVDPTARTEGATIGPFAVVEAGADIAAGTWVMAHTYVGRGVTIGQRCRLMPHSVVMDGTVLGDRVWLLPGAVVGADGFGHVPGPDGPLRVPQLGTAVIEDDVEIGANACVDRAALDETRVGRGSRLDNLVQVAHGVQIGASCLLAAFAGVAGGAHLGDRVIMAGRTAVIDNIEVGDDVVFAGLASARRNVPAGRRLGGVPARPYMRWLREMAALKQLPDLIRTLPRLEARLAALEPEKAEKSP